ncbi:MAG: UDP-N-acetylglucosamine--N-acetylmuramyl-(pentapeptide) pyrophosphoryl-undecaprenol N-acetylglucosamine transferase [Bacteroidia bacterium]|nr:UDP-N-acetylglucosamine--N-acetylmuramyl-(pentapeptide) pyrophosphoryl-undecaprenol N-acetylglucosamine transferase [Bacteroidia bacterium]MDW8236325.1 UDP-N-acetylglucosamine--N-acetylmuramyl-(pentapeptide) pyrophosphoryl-undecaprenol N-acetylglucosamine transferase [Bacteroidia bacterium]
MSLVIAAGGTGGHVFPALAVAQVWRNLYPDLPIHWIGTTTGREARWVQNAGLPFHGIEIYGWQPRSQLRNLRVFYHIPGAFWNTAKLMRSLEARVVFTTGGYPGLLPGIWAKLNKRPLVLLELNTHAGRTIRWLTPWAKYLFGAFPSLKGAAARDKFRWSGVPVRFTEEDRRRYSPAQAKALWGFHAEQPVLLILGGSQGSSTLNQMMEAALPLWQKAGYGILWQTGKREVLPSPNVRAFPFIEDMAAAYQAAEMVISRAGGSTLGELAWWGKAVVLVPSPYVTGRHQHHNAHYWQLAGAAQVVEEGDVSALQEAIQFLMEDPSQRKRQEEAARHLARSDAADLIAKTLHECYVSSFS